MLGFFCYLPFVFCYLAGPLPRYTPLVDLSSAIAALKRALGHLTEKEQSRVEQAVAMAEDAHRTQMRQDGTPYVTHVIEVAQVLAEWNTDADTIIAGVLHDALEDSAITHHAIRQAFGLEVASLVEGVTKFTQADFEGQATLDRKVETLRKLFEVMRSDIRVVLIKLADRLHNVRTMDSLPGDRQVRFAKETMDIYYKLAYHLGLNDLRRELADRCIPLLYPEHAGTARALLLRMEPEVASIRASMEHDLKADDEEQKLLELRAAPHSLYTLHRHIEDGDLHDEHASHIVAIVRDEDSCYALLKFLHTLYRPISGKFRDFVAAPTESGYQSLHTVVLVPGGRRVQVRIRTPQMDAHEHWGVLLARFGGAEVAPGFSWLQRSESLDRSTKESSESFWAALQSDIFQEVIHVTVNGDALSVPRGATALDAVYTRHGSAANRTLHLMVNGMPVSFGTALQEDDVVQVALDGHDHVVFEWLKAVATRYARTLIVSALKERDQNEKLILGQQLIQQEFDRFQKGLVGELSRAQRQEIATRFRRGSFDEVVVMVGEGVLLARDVVFHLFPEHRSRGWLHSLQRVDFPFRVRITGTHDREHAVLADMTALARIHDVNIHRTTLRQDRETGTFTLHMVGLAPDRLHFADFLEALERLQGISKLQTLLSHRQKIGIGAVFVAGCAVIFADILLLPTYKDLAVSWTGIEALGAVIPLLVILIVNSIFLRVLQHHVAAVRRDRWFLGLGFGLNIAGLILVIGRLSADSASYILPLVAVFLISMFVLGYRFFQMELLVVAQQQHRQPLSADRWKTLKRRKIAGYSFRTGAIVIWGIQPLYLRYTPANEVAPFLRVFLMCIGIIAVSGVLMIIRNGLDASRGRKITPVRIKRNRELWMIIIGGALFTYFLNASLLTTTSTNFILFNNFSPVLALLVAAVFWRRSIPYLQNLRHILWIFCIFLLGSIGSSLLISNSIRHQTGTLTGDIFGVLAMIADTLYVIGQIRYTKVERNASGLSINLYVSTMIALLVIPVLTVLAIVSPAIFMIGLVPCLFALGAGVLSGIGQAFNYETFKRIDGFIAFLMFNISILITFLVEAYVLRSISPNWMLLVGGGIIMSSTILAEWINSRCQKEGLGLEA